MVTSVLLTLMTAKGAGGMTSGNPAIQDFDDQDNFLLANARNYAYYCDMREQMKRGDCSFCKVDPEKNKILHRVDNWRVWACPPDFRAKGLAEHLVVSPDQHYTHLHMMEWEDWSDWERFSELMRIVVGELEAPGFIFAMRFGDPSLHAGSVRHQHANIMVPEKPAREVIPALETGTVFPDFWRLPLGNWRIGEVPSEHLHPRVAKHFVIETEVSNRHKHLQNLSDKDWTELTAGIEFVTVGRDGMGIGLDGGAVIIRSGDPAYNGGADYVRADIIVPNKTGRFEVRVNEEVGVTLSKDPKDVAKKMDILRVFEKIRNLLKAGDAQDPEGVLHMLPLEDQLLVRDRLR